MQKSNNFVFKKKEPTPAELLQWAPHKSKPYGVTPNLKRFSKKGPAVSFANLLPKDFSPEVKCFDLVH
jgi:hypothetical protein